MHVLAISGSLRSGSYNTALLREAAEVAPAGVELELYEGLELLPPYNEDDDQEEGPVEGARLRDAISRADALLIATPEYNGRSLGLAGARVLEVELPVARAHERFDAEGHLLDEQLRERLAETVRELAATVETFAAAA